MRRTTSHRSRLGTPLLAAATAGILALIPLAASGTAPGRPHGFAHLQVAAGRPRG